MAGIGRTSGILYERQELLETTQTGNLESTNAPHTNSTVVPEPQEKG